MMPELLLQRADNKTQIKTATHEHPKHHAPAIAKASPWAWQEIQERHWHQKRWAPGRQLSNNGGRRCPGSSVHAGTSMQSRETPFFRIFISLRVNSTLFNDRQTDRQTWKIGNTTRLHFLWWCFPREAKKLGYLISQRQRDRKKTDPGSERLEFQS